MKQKSPPDERPTAEIQKTIKQAAILHAQGKLKESELLYKAALLREPNNFDVLHLLGVLHTQDGRREEALKLLSQALEQVPQSAEAHSNLGVTLSGLHRDLEAIASYDKALSLKPDYPEALCNRGNALAQLGHHVEAIASYDRALALKPDYVKALDGRGTSLSRLHRFEEALVSHHKALALNPASFRSLHSIGSTLANQHRDAEAIAYYNKALAINPDDAMVLSNRASSLTKLEQYGEAISCYEKALKLNCGLPYVAGHIAFFRAHLCDWSGRTHESNALLSVLESGALVSPFSLVTLSDDPAAHQKCAVAYVRDKCPARTPPLRGDNKYHHQRIRVAYLSADFHGHATSYLAAGLFEHHDRSGFEAVAISYGPDQPGSMRTRLQSAFEHFIDARHDSDYEIARRLKELEIDIAVDLKGYTHEGRPGILAYRPAPIQVNYLGFPGTLGADYIDYILADRFVIPEQHHSYYTEHVVYLPDCYQVNDSSRAIAKFAPSRRDAGLPEEGFVFCCFNNSYKLTPTVFDVWMRLLGRIDGSVIWLLRGAAIAESNLRQEAEKRGINPDRLVFAPRADLEHHLARHQLADLFLDTLPCNAHTTASDALWAGLPLVTCAGNTFAGRVAGSLLHAIGLPELVTTSLADYEALALELATAPDMLRKVRGKLQLNRMTSPLFNIDRFRQQIEAAFTTMWQIQQRGEPPRCFAVPNFSE